MEEFIRVGRQTLFPQLANDPVCSAGMKALMERLTESLLAQIWLLVVYEREKKPNVINNNCKRFAMGIRHLNLLYVYRPKCVINLKRQQ